MYRGFTVWWPTGGCPELRLAPVEGDRKGRPSLVTWARHPATATAAALLGRVFYRADLTRRLPDPRDLGDGSDAAVALAAYRQLGRRGLELVEGEFALVVWDGRRRTLLAQRDPFGTWPLFWSAGGGGVAAGTSPAAVADAGPGRSLDPDTMAEFLMQPMPADELPCEQSFFRGVRRVRPGRIVELDGRGGAAEHHYWDWATRITPTGAMTPEEAGAEFRERLRAAVRERTPAGAPLAVHLSGGMDSSSVTCLARDEQAARGGPPVATLSLVYRRRALVGERAYIDAVLRQGGPVQPHLLEADDVVYYDWFSEDLPRHDEPSGLLRSMPSHRLLVRAADRLGAVMTLGGDGSDEIASYQPYHLADLVRRGRWLAAVREAGRWSRARNRGLGSVLRQYALEPLAPVWWREGWGPRRGGFGVWPRLGFFSVPPWVRPGFARRHRMRDRGRDYARRVFGPPTELSWNLSMLATTSGDWQRWHLAAPLGLNLSQPFRDPRLVCFTLGLPADVRGVPGVTKPVLQTAMRGVLPEEIRTKRCSPGFDDVFGLGLRRNMPHLERLVRHPGFAELGVIDPDRFIPALRQAALGIGDSQATDRLDKVLSLIAWFDQFHRPAAEPWTTSRRPNWRCSAGG